MIFVLNGNAFSEAKPTALTADAARVLNNAGHRAIQLATPEMDTPGAFYGLVRRISSISKGRPIGIVGFSAGGSQALRLATVRSLNVRAVLDYYGPPDLEDYLKFHRGDAKYHYLLDHVSFTPSAVKLFSGPIRTSAYVVAAFGRRDDDVVARMALDSLTKTLPTAKRYTYAGPHGVGIHANREALKDFLAHV